MSALGSRAGRTCQLLRAALVALACVSCKNARSPDGKTNGLVSCGSDAECPSGTCACGVCTAPCSSERPSCATAPSESSCFARGSFTHAALCADSSSEGICLPPCATDTDCADDNVCLLGACWPPEAAPGDVIAMGPSAEAARLSALAAFSDGWGLRFEESLTIEGELSCADEGVECPTLETLLSQDACYDVRHGCGLYYVAGSAASASYWYEAFAAPPVAAVVTSSVTGRRVTLSDRSLECDAIEIVCSTCGDGDIAHCRDIPGAFPERPPPEPVPGCSCEPDGDNAARVSLDCFCNMYECPAAAPALQACIDASGTYRRGGSDGCGGVWVEQGVHGVLRFAFDAASGALVGAVASSGAPVTKPCATFQVHAGAALDCEPSTTCDCGDGEPGTCASPEWRELLGR